MRGSLVGVIHGEGQGYTVNHSVTLPWVAAAASALYQQRIWGPLAWGSRASFVVPFTRHAFRIDNVGNAFTPGPVGAALDAELRVTIW